MNGSVVQAARDIGEMPVWHYVEDGARQVERFMMWPGNGKASTWLAATGWPRLGLGSKGWPCLCSGGGPRQASRWVDEDMVGWVGSDQMSEWLSQ